MVPALSALSRIRSGQGQRWLQRLDPALTAQNALELGAADRDVALVAADFDLRTLGEGAALLVHPHDHRRFAAGVADGLDLDELIRPGEQILAALEELAAKIGAKPIGEHRDAERIDDFAELPDLSFGEKLRLIDEDAVQRAVRGQIGADQAFEIVVAVEGVPRALSPIREATMPSP